MGRPYYDTCALGGNSVDSAPPSADRSSTVFACADGHNNEDYAAYTNNVWWYQGEQANKIFQTLDDQQQAQAAIANEVEADDQRWSRSALPQTGLAIAGLDSQQGDGHAAFIDKMLSPFRAFGLAAEVAHACGRQRRCLSKLRLGFYKEGDIGNDRSGIFRARGPAAPGSSTARRT